MKFVNEAVDAVRRAEAHAQPNLKKTRWLWLKNITNLNEQQQKQLEQLRTRNTKTARAYQMRLSLQEIFTIKEKNEAVSWLKTWIEDAKNSELPPMVKGESGLHCRKPLERHCAMVRKQHQQRYSGRIQ